jgi:ABC-type dipeptide/oligopeptide/nickel transport system permease component
MIRFIIRRTLVGIPVLFLTILTAFTLVRLIPGGPFDNIGGKSPPDWLKAAWEARYGLDKPLFLNLPNDGSPPDYNMDTRTTYDRLPNCDKLRQGVPAAQAIDPESVVVTHGWYLLHLVQEHTTITIELGRGGSEQPVPCDSVRTVLYSDLLRSQFFEYLDNVLRFDFGPSLGRTTLGIPVRNLIGQRLPVSAQLGILSVIFGFLLGVPLGVLAAVHHNTIVDYLATLLAVVLTSVPSFVLGPTLLIVFINYLHLLPGPNPIYWRNPNFLSWDYIGRAILPVFTLGVGVSAGLARLTRASLLQVLEEDYIRTARAKGMRERGVIYIHALKNALIPVATLVGPLLAGVLLGSLFVEQVFAIPGLGDSFITSVSQRDYNLLVGVSLLYSLFLILGNILVDILYTWLDPRIRYD